MNQKKLLNPKDIEKEYGISKWQVYKWVEEELITFVRIKRKIYIPREALEQFLERNTTIGLHNI